MIRSLRGILLFEIILAIASVVTVSGVVLYLLVESVLIAQFDRSLADTSVPIAISMEQDCDKVDLNLSVLDLRELQRPERLAYLHVRSEDGSDLFRSAALGEAALDPIPGTQESPGFRRLTLPDGRAGRALGFNFIPREDSSKKKRLLAEQAGIPWVPATRKLSLVLARDTAAITVPLKRIGILLGCVSAIVTASSAGLLWWILLHNLRPLNRLAGQIARLDGEDLSARIDVPGAPIEIQPIADRMNEFLERLEAAFFRERSFTTDVAHELRTPLAGIRSTIEVALSRLRTPHEYEESLEECRGITLQMQSMVEKLLLLARIEAGHTRIEPQAIFLRERLNAAWKPLEGAAAARGLQVEWAADPVLKVLADPVLLDVLLHNVFENAVEYANRGGTVRIEAVRIEAVRIEAAAPANGVRLRVRNTGSALSSEEAQHSLERFWRGDAAHSEACVHCGVGLVLVKNIAGALGGSVEVRSEKGGWFEIAVTIPDSEKG